MKLTDNILRQLVRESIESLLNESIICEASGDLTTTMRKKITKYINDKLESGDEDIKQLISSLGYNLNYNLDDARNIYRNLFKEHQISKEVVDDILNVANILSNYVDNNGNIFLRRTEANDRKDVRYLEDDYPTEKVNEIIRLKEFMELNGLSYLFDKKANIGTHKYGMSGKYDDTSNLDFNNITDKEKETYIKGKIASPEDGEYLMKRAFMLKYLNAKYGMELKIPNISFSKGNKKLPNSTLIINFDSAVGCPAWNECIVKHACYARGGEKIHNNVYQANKNRTLMWRATQNDPELLKLLMDFVKSYCFNYENAAKEIVKMGLTKIKNVNTLVKKLSTTPLNDAFFTPEILNIMSNNKRIENIRLNENGDFIGQWLVDAWDNAAAELKLCGINTSAYTCRHLNYEGVKNIILNSSFISEKGNIARHFIAVPEEIYNLLEETYNGKNNQLVLNKNNVVIPNYKPLFDIKTGQPNGRLYYKCPCDRKIGKNKINCYQCQVCYQPNPNQNQTIVFVKAHGSGAKNLSRDNINTIGVSQNLLGYDFSSIKNNKKKKNEGVELNYKSLRLDENVYNSSTVLPGQRLGIKLIANNAIKSLYQRLNGGN